MDSRTAALGAGPSLQICGRRLALAPLAAPLLISLSVAAHVPHGTDRYAQPSIAPSPNLLTGLADGFHIVVASYFSFYLSSGPDPCR